ncbi:atherin-like [Schistocerca americana]|uniref:atherin-like n=1 Tax=Schistocerca americana TaxID=7009 RepID=UPI001F4F9211|nr:atherin-like [Schistocerca americana]
MAGKQIAAALEALIHAMGFYGGRQRQPKRKRTQRNRKSLQCYNCQQLGHIARECKNAAACLKCAAAHDTRCCTKPRGVASSCANCGGPHAANSRSCGYLRESRRLPAAPRSAAASSATTAAPPPPRSGEGCEPRRLEAATDHAMAGFQAAFAAERAALKEELAAVHRQLQQLRDELRAIKKKPPVPAAAPPPPAPPTPVSRPVGVDAATQTTAAPPPTTMQEAAPMETDDVPPGLPPSKVAATSYGAS